MNQKQSETPITTVREPLLRRELLEMAERDQEMRSTIGERYRHPDEVSLDDQRWWIEIDSRHTARLREIIEAHGWPGRSLVGDDGSYAAWLLVQHADQAAAFQRHCLTLLRAAVEAGEADPEQLAYLADRVCVNLGQPQFYGTQMQMVDDQIMPWPIQDEANVDARRAALGLEPLAEYLAQMHDASDADGDDNYSI
jgi:hypothetical protein